MEKEEKVGPVTLQMTLDQFRRLIYEHVKDILNTIRLSLVKTDSFVPRNSVGLSTFKSLSELYNDVTQSLDSTQTLLVSDNSGHDKGFMRTICTKMACALDSVASDEATASDLLLSYRQTITLTDTIVEIVSMIDDETLLSSEMVGDRFKVNAECDDMIKVTASGRLSPTLADALRRDIDSLTFLALVTSTQSDLRNGKQKPSCEQMIATNIAYKQVEKGNRIPSAYKWLGLPGRRDYTHTYLFITDPGPGNINITCQDNELMRGVTVHTEHIDRGNITEKSLVEAYRLPAHTNAAKVRLHVGHTAPCCAFIGRPVFEGLGLESNLPEATAKIRQARRQDSFDLFEIAILKGAHMTASACTSMFINGIAECKIAIEKMSRDQAISFMKSVRANVIRDAERQFLSAAFNIFTPIPIQNEKGDVTMVTDYMEIARLAIDIAEKGGFEKVTWDGAENRIPSRPITESLGHRNLVSLVHEAHGRGLITYVSAGIDETNVQDAVFAGVDGIGIGTSLHYRDGMRLGELKKENIKAALEARDKAAASPLGQAAAILAGLDWQFHEGSLEVEHIDVRESLFQALLDKDHQQIKDILSRFKSDEEVDLIDGNMDEHACAQEGKSLSRARSILKAKSPLISHEIGSKWDAIKDILQENTKRAYSRDIRGILSLLDDNRNIKASSVKTNGWQKH